MSDPLKDVLAAAISNSNAALGGGGAPGGAAEAARVHARDAVEYLASVVEFDGFDDLDSKRAGRTTRVATATYTPAKLDFTGKALRAARSARARACASLASLSLSSTRRPRERRGG